MFKSVYIKITYLFLILYTLLSLQCYADEIELTNQKPLTLDIRPVNIQEYKVHTKDNKNYIIDKLIASPFRFLILPMHNGLLFIFKFRF
jgi:hypothetical protein